nr:putative ribonuclease H-like domain-containing protein [Tanacetum cinerariifolium]
GNPQQDLKDKGVIESGCSRHMIGNRSYLIDYEEINGGFVTFRGNSKEGKITGKGEEEKKDDKDTGNKDNEVLSIEEPRVNQEKDSNVNSTNNINTEDISIFEDSNKDVFGAEDDLNNLDSTFQVSPILTTSIHKDYRLEQVIGDLHSSHKTRRMTKRVTEHGMFSSVQQRINHKDFQNCMFAYFLSQIDPKKVIQALTNPSWIEAMQDELLHFKLQQVWTLVDLPNGKRAIGTKWVYRTRKMRNVLSLETRHGWLHRVTLKKRE